MKNKILSVVMALPMLVAGVSQCFAETNNHFPLNPLPTYLKLCNVTYPAQIHAGYAYGSTSQPTWIGISPKACRSVLLGETDLSVKGVKSNSYKGMVKIYINGSLIKVIEVTPGENFINF